MIQVYYVNNSIIFSGGLIHKLLDFCEELLTFGSIDYECQYAILFVYYVINICIVIITTLSVTTLQQCPAIIEKI